MDNHSNPAISALRRTGLHRVDFSESSPGVRTCPPCDRRCRQGRECPANASASRAPAPALRTPDEDTWTWIDSLVHAAAWIGVVVVFVFCLGLSAGYFFTR